MAADQPIIFVVDDEASVRHALAEMLRVFGYTVVTHETADSLLQSLDFRRAGCVVADVRMPGTDGIGLVRELSSRGIALPVILISGHADVPMAVTGVKAGAEDFIEKPVDDRLLVAAINRGLVRRAEFQRQQGTMQALHDRFARLTRREVEVLDLVAQGHTSLSTSAILGISMRTVESYRGQIMDKLQAGSVAELVRIAIRLGRISA